MPRFHVRYPQVQEGQKHSDELFATDDERTVRHWLEMCEHFYVWDTATGTIMWNQDDLDLALAKIPLSTRDWSQVGSIDPLDYE